MLRTDIHTYTHPADSGGIAPVQLQQTFNLWQIRAQPDLIHTTWQQTVAADIARTSPDVNLATSHLIAPLFVTESHFTTYFEKKK